ncbi:hypothetical protein MLD38_028379 [Melastoma candidum]|uniref:Uncharacterized protein n=1 Tax=Melastoma candidum TaxID=119954 RepID=A0ACB9N2G6_9MYRT|nr:hypothetical protein MLD38_028379 [Melastoma candidum]
MARNSLEGLREVLDNIDLRRNAHSKGVKDEFILDLVEQCSFQKQRAMHLVSTSRHGALVSGRPVRRTFQPYNEIEEESETEQLFRRSKGKSRAIPKEDPVSSYRHLEDFSRS